MLRATALAFVAATVLGTSGVSAQTIELGPRGPSVDLRNDRQRDRDFRREDRMRDMDEDRRDRRRAERRELSTGSVGCRTVTVRERDDSGRTVVRKTRECR